MAITIICNGNYTIFVPTSLKSKESYETRSTNKNERDPLFKGS